MVDTGTWVTVRGLHGASENQTILNADRIRIDESQELLAALGHQSGDELAAAADPEPVEHRA
jgi:hypothetical protein